VSSAEKEFPGLRFDPAPGLVPSIDQLAAKVREASGQLGNARAELEKALRDPGAWAGPAGGSCHDAVQHIYPDVWIMHDAVSGVERTLGEWSFLLADYQRSRTSLEAQAVEARAAVGRAKDNPDLSIDAAVVFSGSDQERKAFFARYDAAKQAADRAEDQLDGILAAAKDLKKQHDESAKTFGGRIRGFADDIPSRDTMAPGGSGISPAYFTKPPPQAEDMGPKREFDVTDPTAKDRATRLAAQLMVVGQDAYFDNDRAASYMKNWLEGDGRDVQFDARELVNADPAFQQVLNETIKSKGPQGNFDTGWQPGNIYDDMKKGGASKELQDFYYTMNGYQYRIVGTDFTMVDGHPVGQVRVDVYKRYNWGNPEGGTPRNDIEGVPQNDLARLNETGLAHDFDIVGSTTFYAMPSPS
jgi:hypothetical protein